jgi:hypothetical protein
MHTLPPIILIDRYLVCIVHIDAKLQMWFTHGATRVPGLMGGAVGLFIGITMLGQGDTILMGALRTL